MGDAGSYLVGYLLAMATLTATFAGGSLPRHAILAPLCVLAVPLYDTASVVLIRLRAGRSPFEGDKSHFSHRLVELGMTQAPGRADDLPGHGHLRAGGAVVAQVNLGRRDGRAADGGLHAGAGRRAGDGRPPPAVNRNDRHDATEAQSGAQRGDAACGFARQRDRRSRLCTAGCWAA